MSTSYPDEVRIVERDGRRFVLVGTAHISRASVDLVEEVIAAEQPQRVCVELDPQRYEALSKQQQWESLDLKQVIRRKQLPTLLVNLLLAAYQKRLGGQLGVQPGSELLAATRAAEALDIPFDLCDRDVRITLRRASRATSFWRKLLLGSELLASTFDNTEISEEQLQELKQQDALNELMRELGEHLPALKRVLIDERDAYLSERIRRAEGDRLVAVVGAGHLQGIEKALAEGQPVDLGPLEEVAPKSKWWKVVGWGIPIIILGSIAWIGRTQGLAEAGDNALFWVIANSIPAGLGAVLAFAHPLTIVAAVVAAPLASLTPVIGTAYVTAFVQAYFVPPLVKEFQTFADDAGSVGGWWRSRLLRIFLAFILPGLGSMVGSWVGGARIVSSLFGAE